MEGVKSSFMHYPIDKSNHSFVYPFKRENFKETLVDNLFSEFSDTLVGFGHTHVPYNSTINSKTYINPGSLGCFDKPIARFIVIEFHQGNFRFKNFALEYDDSDLYDQFEKRSVPDRKFIYKAFFGGRFVVKKGNKKN